LTGLCLRPGGVQPAKKRELRVGGKGEMGFEFEKMIRGQGEHSRRKSRVVLLIILGGEGGQRGGKKKKERHIREGSAIIGGGFVTICS